MNSEGLKAWGIGERFTVNQSAAATHDGNIIVSAGAGSGKTTVMIARIMGKILDGEKLDRMLIVTFTRSAAADMRVKLAQKLTEVRTESKNRGDGVVYGRVSEAIEAMSVCNIGTLHSYCQRLVKRYYGVAELDPAATVGEEGDIELLKSAAVDDAISERLEAERDPSHEGARYFCDMYEMLLSKKKEYCAESIIKSILDFALSVPDTDGYLADAEPDDRFFGILDADFERRVKALEEPIALLKNELAAKGMAKHVTVIDEFIDYARGRIDEVTKTSHKTKLDETDALNEEFKALKKKCAECRKLKLKYDELEKKNSAPYASALTSVAKRALELFSDSKNRQNKLDYSDLEHGAFRVINDPDCVKEIMQSVEYVFIDEFQDVNPLQHAFMKTFKDMGAEMFVVGDVKQSVYGFRRCSPAHFREEISHAAELGTPAQKGQFTHIPLFDNFRTSRVAVDFINGIFDATMTDGFGGADYKNRDRLICGKKDAPLYIERGEKVALPDTERAELVIIDTEKNLRDTDVYSVVKAAADENAPDPEAEFIASAVEKYIELSDKRVRAYNATAEKNKRIAPPELGEIAVLMRGQNQKFCAELAREFDKRGIRYNFGKKSSVKSYPAAVALTDILRCVDNRFDDVALYTALRSPMGGFSDLELAEIAAEGGAALYGREIKSGAAGRERPRFEFWQKVEAYRGEHRSRLDRFFSLIGEIFDYSQKHDCGDTLGYITSRIAYFQHVYETGGDARAVEALIEYAANKRCDAHDFLTFYDSSDFVLELDSGSDAVNITTMHSSKGLEYDFVVVADTGRGFNYTDIRKKVLISESGTAVKIPNPQTLETEDSAPFVAQKLVAPDNLLQEELRLFYVALTRAKKKLIVCGKRKPSYKAPTSPEKAKSMLDFACFGAGAVTPDAALAAMDGAIKECEKYTAGAEAPAYAEAEDIVPEIAAAVKARCEKICARTDVPIKACVTSLAHEAATDGSDDYTSGTAVLTSDDRAPRRGEYKRVNKKNSEANIDARLRGTAYHRAMELIDFADPDYDGLGEKCENFELVDAEKIKRAVAVMQKLTAGKTYFKERYFIVDMPREYIDGSTSGSVLVQGVIDLMIADGEFVTVVDYKTGDPASLLNDGYILQLKLYARAVEMATAGKFKAEKALLYSFESGEIKEVKL